MEDWQRQYVFHNLDKLISNTKCYKMLISTLVSKNVMTPVDWDVESMKCRDRFEQADTLYEILLNRSNAYEEVILALHITNQKGAVEILMKGFEINKVPIPSNLSNIVQPASDFKAPPEGVLDLISQKYSKYSLIISATNSDITEKRIKQSIRLPSIPVHFINKLKQFLREPVLNFEENQMIVVTCHSKVDFKVALSDLRQQNIETQAIKVVIITKEVPIDISTSLVQFQIDQERVRIFKDDPQWEALTGKCKSELLQRQILLQGQGLQLHDFCFDNNQLKFLKDVLASLLNDEEPELFAGGIPFLQSYYIGRRLRSKRFQVPLKVIEDSSSSDVITIANIDIAELRKLQATRGSIAESTDLVTENKLSSQRFIILKRDAHFDIICKKTSSTVHHLHYHKSHFEWLKTRGSISLMQKYTRDTENVLNCEKEFIMKCEQYSNHILVSDKPGMGKTTLFKSFALQLKQHHPSRLVLFVILSEFISELYQRCHADTTNKFDIKDIVELLIPLEIMGHDFVQQQLFMWLNEVKSNAENSDIKCEILFDGFDEVLSYHRNLAEKVLVFIGVRNKNFRIWVSTSPAFANHLEEILSVLSDSLEPFSSLEQRDFLSKYWMESYELDYKNPVGETFQVANEWHKQYLLDNLDMLLSCTLCCNELISTLIAKHVLTRSDWDMELMKTHDRYDQAHKFYEIIITRENFYNELIQALFASKQGKAIDILMKGFEIHGESIPSCLMDLSQCTEAVDQNSGLNNLSCLKNFVHQAQSKQSVILPSFKAEIIKDKHVPNTIKDRYHWQRKYILDNLGKLVLNTKCNAVLISILIAKNIISKFEWDMQSMKYLDRYAQANRLYEILMTRDNAYEEIVQALHSTNQAVAIEILMKGYACSGEPIPSCLTNLSQSTGEFESLSYFKSPPAGLLDFFSQTKTKHSVIIVATNAEITEKRILETIQLPSFVVNFPKNLKQFLKKQELNFEHDQVIVVTCPYKRTFKDALSDLQQQNFEVQVPKIIIITEENTKVVNFTISQLKIQQERIRIVTDDPHWDDLTDKCKLELLQRKVIFQKHSIRLLDFCSDPKLLKLLKGNMLAALLNDEEPEIYSEVTPSLPTYYIERQLRSKRFQVSLKVIEESSTSDVFVMSDIDVNELRKFKITSGCIAESIALITEKLSTQRFIILTRNYHFDIICNKTPAPVHWLRYHKTHFEWIKTHGSISLMQEHTKDTHVDLVTETEFILQCEGYNDPILISDTPGMGKTILCKSFAIQLKQLYPSRLVLFITLSDFVREFYQRYPNVTAEEQLQSEDIVDLLVPSKKNYSSLMKQKMMDWLTDTDGRGVKCEVLFDGFDEVLPYQRELAKKMLTWFKLHRNNLRVWVATRPAHLRELEMTLTVLGHNIRPFEGAEAREFLKRYWLEAASGIMYDKDTGNRFEIALGKFADNCFKGLTFKQDNFAKIMTGIPLECFMLANIYEEDAINFAAAEVDSDDLSHSDPKIIPIDDIVDLYEKLLTQKLNIFFCKRNIRFESTDPIFLTLKMKMNSIHMRLSVEFLYPMWCESMKKLLSPLTEEEKSEVLSYGIVESYDVNEQPRFVHRTFAEYYLALFTISLVSESNKFEETVEAGNLITEFLFRAVLQTSSVSNELSGIPHFRNIVIVHFFNQILNQNHCLIPKRSLKTPFSSYKKIKYVILGCLTSGKLGIFEMLTSIFNKHELIELLTLNATSSARVLELITCNSSVKVFSKAVSFLNFLDIFIDKFCFKKLLLSAVENGNVDIVHYIISNNLEISDWENIRVLHHCLKSSWFVNEPREISKLQNVMSCLVDHSRNILEEQDDENCSPLIAFKCNFLSPYEMTDHLIKLGADVNVTSIDANILRLIFFRVPACVEKQKDSFLLLKQHNLDISKMLSSISRSEFGVLFPFLAKAAGDLCPDIANIADVLRKTLTKNPQSPGLDFSVYLPYIDFPSCDNFRSMLEDLKVPFTFIDKDGNTLLHLVLQKLLFTSTLVIEEIVKYLLFNGLNPNQVNNQGQVPLQVCFFPVSLRLLQVFNSSAGDILGKHGCETMQEYLQHQLIRCFIYPCYPVVSYLIDKGAHINCKTKEKKESLLHLAVKIGCLDTVKLLTDLNPSLINAVNIDGLSPLHVALMRHLIRPICVHDWLIEKRNPIVQLICDEYDGRTNFFAQGTLSLGLAKIFDYKRNIMQAFYCSTNTRSQLLEMAMNITSNPQLLRFCRQMIYICTEPDDDFIGFNDFEDLPHVKCWEQKNNIDVVKHLLENGANLNFTGAGNTPLHLVLLATNYKFEGEDKLDGLLQWEQAFIPILKLFIEHGADLHCLNNEGKNCLHIASSAGLMKVVAILVEKCGVDVNIKDKNGLTALEYAVMSAKKYDDEIIESVIQYLSMLS